MAYAAAHDHLVPEVSEASTVAGHHGWFARFLEAMIESRQRAARREIARHEFFVSDTARVMKGVTEETLPFRG